MIYVDDSAMKVGGVILPGLIKSMEIKSDAQIDEQTVQGSTAKPKQATGYEDAKITVELILDDGPKETKEQKLTKIQNIFRAPGQAKPVIHEIVNTHTAIRGIKKVIFKSLSSKEQNTKNELSVSLEFWEYVPITITAAKAGSTKKSSTKKGTSKNGSSSSGLSAAYQSYLKTGRGKAPKAASTTAKTPAKDTASTSTAQRKINGMVK